jgi:hypothetical protein
LRRMREGNRKWQNGEVPHYSHSHHINLL